jgi:hypothetical protein
MEWREAFRSPAREGSDLQCNFGNSPAPIDSHAPADLHLSILAEA